MLIQKECRKVWLIYKAPTSRIKYVYLKPEVVGTSIILHIRKMCVHAQLLSQVHLFSTPWPVAHQDPLSMGFSRQQYWNGLSCPPPGDLPDPGIKPTSLTLHWQAGSLPAAPPGKPLAVYTFYLLELLFWLPWVLAAAHRLSLVVVCRGYSSLGFMASHCGGFSCCGTQALGTQASVAAACGLSGWGRVDSRTWAQ